MKVLACPDLHAPFTDVNAVCAFYAAIEKEKPNIVIQLGDLYDMYSMSKFPKKNDISAKEEMLEGREFAENFWKNVQKVAGRKTRFLQILGNHDDRPSKRLLERFADIAHLVGIDHLFKFSGVETILDSRHELQIDGVIYTHGHFTRHGAHASYYCRSVVHGHSHRGAVIFQRLHGKTIWELDCGHMADENTEALQYTATKTTKWTKGYGIIDELGPRFVPL